ncbi:MAG: efflux RND transporter periplasmic adaptor subunit [Cytophagaceae bacterium]|jgi:cobalt-zinc-cadmium efflux system membrane fusion protein|nr:efflux RND transporter periplasmic adaptor subunit [Cytophagaceae bacterium]
MNYFIYTIGIFGFLLTTCSAPKEEQETRDIKANEILLTEAQRMSASITVDTVQLKTLQGSIQASGQLDVPPQNLITISALLGGYIKKTDLLPGKKVKKGEVLFVIENPEFLVLQRSYLETKSKLTYLELEYKRQEALYQQNIGAAQAFQEAQANYISAQAQLSDISARLSLVGIQAANIQTDKLTSTATIISPENGFVSRLEVNIGKYVSPQDVLCDIVNTSHLHVELFAYEKDLNKLKEGQAIEFKLMNDETKSYTATVYLIQRTIQNDRTVRIHGHLTKEDPNLLPNMYVQGKIIVTSARVLALPSSAVVQANGKNYVFIEKKSTKDYTTYEAIPIDIGLSSAEWTEVLLSESIKKEKFVTTGAYTLLSILLNKEEE